MSTPKPRPAPVMSHTFFSFTACLSFRSRATTGSNVVLQIRCEDALPELLGEPDENPFGAADVAEPIRLFVLNHFANELRATRAEPGKRLVDVVHSEHDAQVAESVHRGVPVIGDDGRG